MGATARVPGPPPTEAPGGLRLRSYLALLVLAVLLPALALAGAASWATLRGHERASEARLLDTARALASAVDSTIISHVAALTALAASPDAAADGDPRRLRALASSTGATLDTSVIVFARGGAQFMNTQLPEGAPLPGAGAPLGANPASGLERVFATARPHVTDIAVGRVSRRAQAVVYVPVIRDGVVQRVVGMLLVPERLSAVLAAGRRASDTGAAALTDSQGILVARSRDTERVLGQQMPPRPDLPAASESGLLHGKSMADGGAIRTAYHRLSQAPGWTVWVNEPEATFSAGWRDSLAALTGGAILALLVAFAAVTAVSRRLLRPVEALVAHAEAVAEGRAPDAAAPAVPPAGVAEFERLRRALTGAEAAMREGEARLRRVQRIGRVGGFEIDFRTGTNWRSGEYMALQGLAPVTAREAHEHWVRRLHPEDRERAERAFLDAVADGAPHTDYAQDYRVLTPEGEVRWISARAVIERDVGGRTLRMVGAHVDVTPLKAIEAELRLREAELRGVLDNAPVGVIVAAAPSGRIVLSNRRAEEILGQPIPEMGEVAEYGGLSGYHPDGRRFAAAEYPLVRALAGEELAGQEMLWQPGEGPGTWLSIGAAPVRDAAGAVASAVVVFADVTEPRRAAAAVAESEARLRLALEAGQVGTFDWNLRSGELAWNPRMRELFALPPGMEVTFAVFRAALHPEDVPATEAAVEAALDPAGDGALNVEYRAIGVADGLERRISAQGRTEFAGGRAVRLIGMAIDVTPLRRAAEVLAREAEQLERLAERRGRALAESEARLAEATRMEALGRLAGGIAHDINNVLQAVQGGLRLAARRMATDPEGARRYLSLAGDAAARGADVTGRLLSFARRGELRAEPIAPAPLLEGLAEMLRHTLGPDIAVRVEAPPDLPALSADRSQLEAVLVNLANNGRDAMPGGGALVLRAALPPLFAPRPPELRPGEYLRLDVADAGEGMPAEVLARVTEPFFTTKPRGQGTGLGLAMARGFAEQSGGALEIESRLGRGTTVSLWLPVAAATAQRPAAPPATRAAAPTGGRPVVLLAEDQPEIRELIGVELEEGGFTVARAHDAAAALALLEGGLRPDALVTDFAMPGGLDGLELVEAARRRLPRLAVVLVTGHVGDAAAERLELVERGGPFALLRKPVAPERLLDCLGRVLGPARARATATTGS
jgi:signal transduction histidine kinase/ActR/RegA family two-component response regulator